MSRRTDQAPRRATAQPVETVRPAARAGTRPSSGTAPPRTRGEGDRSCGRHFRNRAGNRSQQHSFHIQACCKSVNCRVKCHSAHGYGRKIRYCAVWRPDFCHFEGFRLPIRWISRAIGDLQQAPKSRRLPAARSVAHQRLRSPPHAGQAERGRQLRGADPHLHASRRERSSSATLSSALGFRPHQRTHSGVRDPNHAKLARGQVI